jgi:hypothetical protein
VEEGAALDGAHGVRTISQARRACIAGVKRICGYADHCMRPAVVNMLKTDIRPFMATDVEPSVNELLQFWLEEAVAGPGDSIGLMGLSVQCGVNIYLFVPPKDCVRPGNAAYRCWQILGSAVLRKPPTLHLTIANGHFTALTNPTRKFVTANKCFGVEDLSREGYDPATGGYVLPSNLLWDVSFLSSFVQMHPTEYLDHVATSWQLCTEEAT